MSRSIYWRLTIPPLRGWLCTHTWVRVFLHADCSSLLGANIQMGNLHSQHCWFRKATWKGLISSANGYETQYIVSIKSSTKTCFSNTWQRCAQIDRAQDSKMAVYLYKNFFCCNLAQHQHISDLIVSDAHMCLAHHSCNSHWGYLVSLQHGHHPGVYIFGNLYILVFWPNYFSWKIAHLRHDTHAS